MGSKVSVSFFRITFSSYVKKLQKYYCIALSFPNKFHFGAWWGTRWGKYVYHVKSQGAQNYEAHNILLNLLWRPPVNLIFQALIRIDKQLPVTPHFLLSGHLNLYLPIQNLGTFTTIWFTPHKHMAHHNTIPNSATCIHLHTHTKTHPPKLHYSSPSPLTTLPNKPWWYWQHDGTPQHAWKSTHHPTTAQHTNMLPVMLVISESQFNFLMEVCFDPII